MRSGGLRALVQWEGPKHGACIMEFATPGIGHILKAGGAEFCFLDMEHSGFDLGEVKRVLRYLEAAQLPTFVRPPSKAYHHIAGVLDAGAEGLLLPMVSSAEEMQGIIRSMKYVPEGHRGVALGIAHDGYRPGPVLDKLARANRETVCIALIETRAGVENVEAIAAVPGVDVLWIGHFDLSCSLGHPGEFTHPSFIASVERVRRAALSQGRGLGRLVGSVEEGLKLQNEGVDWICLQTDIDLLRGALTTGIAQLKEG
jgi:2-dehydro-3-deoxyglucarate aldolase/4-hydroxy-2-oxoheptanedioate aldolase